MRLARPRRFGSLFFPLRRSYLLTMPAILLGGALPCWATGTDASMIVGAVLLAGISFYLLFDLLGRRRPLRVSTVLAITLGLGYGLGTANTWFTLPRGDATLGDFLQFNTADLAYAMASVMVSIAALISLGELYERPIFGEDFELKFNNRAIVFLTLGVLVIIAAFASGSTGFMGASTGQDTADIGHIGVLASLAEWLLSPLLDLSVCVALNVKGRFTRNYARILSVVLFLMVLPTGRRVLIYSVILSLLALRFGRYRIPYSPLKKVVLLGLLGAVVYVATIGFFYLRLAGYGLIHPTLGQRISAAIRFAEEKNYADVKKDFSENVQRRTFILGFLAQLEGYSHTMQTANGEDLTKQVQLALPSVLYSDKDLFFTEEALANEKFGSRYTDEANSVYTAGALDFGVWGVILYPLLAVLMFRASFEFLAETMPVFASCFIILASLGVLLEPETSVTSYFVVIRNGIFFGGVIWLIMSLPEFRVRNVGL